MHGILVVDSDRKSNQLFHKILSDEGFRTTLCSCSSQVYNSIRDGTAGVLALLVEDVDIPAFELIGEMRRRGYSQAIVFVTRRASTEDKVRGLRLGADDYVTRPFEFAELVERIKAILRTCQKRHIELEVGDCVLSLSQLTYRNSTNVPVLLTPTEVRLLEKLMRNANSVVSRSELIKIVWGVDYIHSTNRVDVYIARLRRKIEIDPDNPQHLRTIRGEGYLFASQSDMSDWEIAQESLANSQL